LGTSLSQSYTFELTEYLQAGNIDAFFVTLKIFFANIPYELTLQYEKYYQSLFYAIFMLIGLTIDAEVSTNQGRIDCVLQTDDTIYIIKFKLNGSCDDALQQIYDKNYAQKYQGGNFDDHRSEAHKFVHHTSHNLSSF
jgi:ATP-dependent exoDNAse (exonuclease V) beta subunit